MIKKSIKRNCFVIRLSHLLQDEEATHIMNFKDISVINIFFVPYLLRDCDSTLHTYSDSIFGHEYCL